MLTTRTRGESASLRGRRPDHVEPVLETTVLEVLGFAGEELPERLDLIWLVVAVPNLEPERGVLEGLEQLVELLVRQQVQSSSPVPSFAAKRSSLLRDLDERLPPPARWRRVAEGLGVGHRPPLHDVGATVGCIQRWALSAARIRSEKS